MGDRSEIEWTEATWNPVVGCSKVSAGCKNCYAEMLHGSRLAGVGAYPEFKPWTALNAAHNVTLVPGKLDQPLRWSRPRMIFVNSMSDLFHELVPDDYIADVFAVMALGFEHTFQVLTKRPDRMASLLNSRTFWDLVWAKLGSTPGKAYEKAREAWREEYPGLVHSALPDDAVLIPPEFPIEVRYLPNVWLGTSIENAKWVGRADDLRRTPAAIRFISAEPLLGPLVPGRSGAGLPDFRGALNLSRIDWLIVGGESGPNYRPPNPGWVTDLRDHVARGVGEAREPCAFLFKQWGGRTPKAGGRQLEGRTWDEYPPLRPVIR